MTIVFDGHNDTLTTLYHRKDSHERSFFKAGQAGQIDFPRARQGGLAGGFFAILTGPLSQTDCSAGIEADGRADYCVADQAE